MDTVNLWKLCFVAVIGLAASTITRPDEQRASQISPSLAITQESTADSLSTVKDAGNLPVIVSPNPSNVNGDGGGGGSFSGQHYTITVTLNSVTTEDQIVLVTCDRPDLIAIPELVIVPGGSSSATTDFIVPFSFFPTTQVATITASCNGGSAEGTINVHYKCL